MVCIHNLTLGLTWVGSLLATSLPIGVKKNNFQIMLGPKELDEQTHFDIYLVCKCLCLDLNWTWIVRPKEIAFTYCKRGFSKERCFSIRCDEFLNTWSAKIALLL